MAELAILGSTLAAGAAEAGAAAAAVVGGAGAASGAAAAGAGAAGAGAAAGGGLSLASIGTLTSLAGAGLGAVGSIQSGKAAKAAGEFNAQELERAANEARADASKKAQVQREKTALVASRQRAVAAASGAGTTEGAGYLDAVGDVAARGEENALSELYIGEQRGRGREGQAAISRWSGEQAVKKSYMEAAGYGVKGLEAGIKGGLGKGWLYEDDENLRYGRRR